VVSYPLDNGFYISPQSIEHAVLHLRSTKLFQVLLDYGRDINEPASIISPASLRSVDVHKSSAYPY